MPVPRGTHDPMILQRTGKHSFASTFNKSQTHDTEPCVPPFPPLTGLPCSPARLLEEEAGQEEKPLLREALATSELSLQARYGEACSFPLLRSHMYIGAPSGTPQDSCRMCSEQQCSLRAPGVTWPGSFLVSLNGDRDCDSMYDLARVICQLQSLHNSKVWLEGLTVLSLVSRALAHTKHLPAHPHRHQSASGTPAIPLQPCAAPPQSAGTSVARCCTCPHCKCRV